MTALGDRLAARIAAEGPLTLASYMAECLLDPDHGYYATRDPFGREGDFTTAPEISQMFGELLGLCLAQCWIDQGRPASIRLAELGPGRGTLMADVLRAVRSVPGFREAATVHLVEASATLRKVQRERLAREGVEWHGTVGDLPSGPLYLIANEFFDALPIRQFERDGSGWAERQVGLVGDRLAPGLAPTVPVGLLSHRLADTRPGDIVEICPALPAIAGEIGHRIAASGGVAIVIDYGGWHSLGDTFQAVRAHKPVDPFANPGTADLTAHVDFEALSTAFSQAGAAVTGMTPQGLFLERLGITARAEALASRLAPAARAAHIAAHRRLTHPAEMGRLFKAIACYPSHCPPPPGFDPADRHDP
ncbi:MAG: SAM-dependent methyltransferase [Rhodobacteraceae bacterium]|nr:SAM-dependent methyltransferase [Paracoccaceae bacterium]